MAMPEAVRLGLPQEIIRRKRDGLPLSEGDIAAFVAGVVDGRVAGEQTGAFLMAAVLRGLDRDETVALTRAMTASGTTLRWPELGGPVLDKHSTGGVGDNVSLMLAPAVAACGGFVPMISGRGLGHTGGTLDKLESIPGYDVRPAPETLTRAVRDVGCAIVGQTADLAPADRVLYAVRDVTATVESIPLITGSILSKKLAAGLDKLVMDVKTGSGAFMPTLEEARALAESLVTVAQGAGLPTRALITDMDQPLAAEAGNALEVANAIRYLTDPPQDPRLHTVVVALGAEMLLLGGLAADRADGAARIEAALRNGTTAERFGRMIAALGGPSDLLERPAAHLPRAPVVRRVTADRPGVVVAIDTRAVGLAVVGLGGGRKRPTDSVDPRVGFERLAAIGAPAEEPLGFVHAADEASAEAAAAALRRAYTIGETAPAFRSPVLDIIGGSQST